MRKRSLFTYLLLIGMILLILGGCNRMTDEEKETLRLTQEAAEAYFHEKYGVEVEFTKHKISPPDLAHTVGFNGHIKDNEEEKVFILVNYDDYTIEAASVPEDLPSKK
ncbi:hypothetical protein SAMN05661091_5491 [Paenibacillus uliginis N3/975]|uniref:DUF1433 domain-containing protein n=2 Tax=Paenibacillus TaxID=44249 RepID=A0A1X7HR97_9BACL|nr:hypothetical protein SAMN05661091_5491 [Paenibacillus uliginis N3/975]